jgi:hypothetical protein
VEEDASGLTFQEWTPDVDMVEKGHVLFETLTSTLQVITLRRVDTQQAQELIGVTVSRKHCGHELVSMTTSSSRKL